jgi:3-oxoacyl-[acyl-carrier protein] reductase
MANTSDLVVVTGAAQGIGLALTQQLLGAGKRVVMLDINEDLTTRMSDEFRSEGFSTYPFGLDVVIESETLRIAAQVEKNIGPIGTLVTCAGITRSGPADSMSLENFRSVIDINLAGTFLSCQAFGKPMLARGQGAIVTISSASGLGGQSGRVNYVASKWAVIGLTKALAIEWGNRGVRVNSVAPGPINTALYAKVPEKFRENVIRQRTPLKRAAEPVEVANVILFLLSENASYINGSIVSVDGGISAGFLTHNSGADLAT